MSAGLFVDRTIDVEALRAELIYDQYRANRLMGIRAENLLPFYQDCEELELRYRAEQASVR